MNGQDRIVKTALEAYNKLCKHIKWDTSVVFVPELWWRKKMICFDCVHAIACACYLEDEKITKKKVAHVCKVMGGFKSRHGTQPDGIKPLSIRGGIVGDDK